MNENVNTFFIDRKETNVMVQARSDLVNKNLDKKKQ